MSKSQEKDIESIKSRNDEDDVLLLEIACEKLLYESELLAKLIDEMKSEMTCTKAYDERMNLLSKYVRSKETYSEAEMKVLRTKLVSIQREMREGNTKKKILITVKKIFY
jgi:hypothetical protein